MLPGRKVDGDLLDELETLLFTADLGVETAQSLLDTVKQQASGGDAEAVRDVLRSAIADKLARVQPGPDALATQASPHVVLVLGVNGSGKTTTIGSSPRATRAQERRWCWGRGIRSAPPPSSSSRYGASGQGAT